MTLHPAGKAGVNLDAGKYHQVRSVMLEALELAGEMTLQELVEALTVALAGQFEGSVSWYATTVKLDLEARGELVCDRRKSPQRIRRG